MITVILSAFFNSFNSSELYIYICVCVCVSNVKKRLYDATALRSNIIMMRRKKQQILPVF